MARDLGFGLLSQFQVFKMHVVQQAAGCAHHAVQHFLVIAERTVPRTEIHDNLAVALRAIATEYVLTHAGIMTPSRRIVGDRRHQARGSLHV